MSVERMEAEAMLPRVLRDEQIRNAHFVDAVSQANRLQYWPPSKVLTPAERTYILHFEKCRLSAHTRCGATD